MFSRQGDQSPVRTEDKNPPCALLQQHLANSHGPSGHQSPLHQASGTWRKASEKMIDLYLREALVLIFQAESEVLDQVRRGVAPIC